MPPAGSCVRGKHGTIGQWDVSNVTDMDSIFSKVSFNGDISKWDVSSVTNMPSMFQNAEAFNIDLSKWDVSSVANMASMFQNTKAFDGDISTWDVSGVTNMCGMFRYAKAFNGDISKWDVSSVSNMDFMFRDAILFKQSLCGTAWVHSTASTDQMFEGSSGSKPGAVCTTTPAFSPKSKVELKSAVDKYVDPFEVHDVSNEGNCLFLSLSIAESWADNKRLLKSREPAVKKRAQELRELANDFLCPNGKPSEELLDGVPIELILWPRGNEGVCGYCARMRMDGEWGTAAEILALTRELNRPITVYHRQGGRIQLLQDYGSELAEDSKVKSPLSILYVGELHYMALIPRKNACSPSG